MSITTSQALLSLCPNAQWSMSNENYSTLNWLDTVQSKPTEQEVNDEIARLTVAEPLSVCKAKAKELISASDWSVLPDVNISNRAEFEEYRSALRELIINPVVNPGFPTEPDPVWI